MGEMDISRGPHKSEIAGSTPVSAPTEYKKFL